MYTGNLIKVSLLGKLGNTDEEFSTAFHIGRPFGSVNGTDWEAMGETLAEQIAALAVSLWSNSTTRIPQGWILTTVKFAYINEQGVYNVDPIEVEVPETPGASILGYAPQLALVATSVSAQRKDPGKYNRMYFPTTVPDLYGGIYLDAGQQQAFADAVANFFSEVNAAIEVAGVTGLLAVVASSKGTGSTLPIINVRAGRVLDTQRRRRNKLTENYVTSEVDS